MSARTTCEHLYRQDEGAANNVDGGYRPGWYQNCLYSFGKYCTYWPPWRRQWHPTPVLLPGKSHGWRRLVGCSPWGREDSDTTERLHFHFSLSCIGEGNGNPLQCSCLENPRDRGAWWAAISGVAQSRTWLMQFSIDLPELTDSDSGMSLHVSLDSSLFLMFPNDIILLIFHWCIWKFLSYHHTVEGLRSEISFNFLS